MERISILLTLLLCLVFTNIEAQNTSRCTHCNMLMNDELHKATAKKESNENLYFGSVECLINFLIKENEAEYSSLMVSDYSSGNMLNAQKAFYLISEAIPSPMGANLSAFKTEKEAIEVKGENSGEVFNWVEINAKFKNAAFGVLNPHGYHDHYRPDANAPVGIMGDHLHAKGGLMVSLRYMNMAMRGNKTGTKDVDNNTIYTNYVVAPQEMTMEMYMLGVMYAPTSKLTLMAMQNFIMKDMELTAQMMMNGMTIQRSFSINVSGLGDLKLGALYGIYNDHTASLHLNSTLNIPIGDIEQKDDTPMMSDAKLPYAMQLGSGTVDFTLGATYKQSHQCSSWGLQFLGTLRTGKNSQDYRFGNNYQLNLWGAYCISQNFSLSARFLGVTEDKIVGADPQLNPMIVTTANTDNYGNNKIKSFAGLNVSFPETSGLKNLRLGIEAGVPIYEHYKGIQMDEDLSFSVGLNYTLQ
jgi:nitrous oxide reductase accessory protein NosL